MKNKTRDEAELWIHSLPVLAGVENGKQADDLLQLFNHPGFEVFLGLLFGARQAQYASLAASPLGTAEAAWRGGVIQGTIKGIELVFNTVLEHTVPSGANEGASS